MKPILIFDYDGTIHNTLGIYEPAFLAAKSWLESRALLEPQDVSTSRIAGWLGVNSIDMWNDFAPELDEENKQLASKMVGVHMAQSVEAGKACWYEGAAEVLSELRNEGYTMLVLSNCKQRYREVHMKHFDMGCYFDEFYDCERYGFIPKTEIIAEIQKEYPGEYVMIGDRASDMAAGLLPGGKFIGCLYGFGSDGELDKAHALIKNIRELPEAVHKLEGNGR
ncbi:MAG: HAD hydrolase-like protein [Firmicutes bacterium]|nr:HAD hydrolase-like protein [Bacillota bacterium]